MAAGFYWSANSPYLRPVWIKVRRAPKGLNPNIAMIETSPGQWDANGAHIIFECMTNRDWGMGANLGIFDVPSFELCAQTLHAEGFGISMMWSRSSPIEDFISEIIDTIHATLFVHPRTGRITLKLLRDDFDIENLRVITPDNATLTNFQRKMWGETANEIVVTYTDPANEGEATLAAQDIANIAMQGGVVSTGRNYYAIRHRDLAARVAERDLRASAQPLATCDAELDHTLYDLIPGEVVLLHWPEKGIEQLVVRVGLVNRGTSDDSRIKTNLYEDIFSLSAASYLVPPTTEWEDPSTDPAALVNVLVHTAPAFIAANRLQVSSPSEIEYPEVITVILAAPNSADDQGFELIGEVSDTTGTVAWTSFGERQFIGSATLTVSLVAEASSNISSFTSPSGPTPLAGQLVFIGDESETEHEIALVYEVTESGWTLHRGVLDTTPKPWPNGTRIWTIPTDRDFADVTLRSEGETVDYRLLTRTSRGLLDFEDAPDETATLTARPHLPSRPANVVVNGVGFGSVVSASSTISITWSNRNRLLETTQVLGWTDTTVTPEAGQTTTVYALDAAGNVLATHNGLSGTSYALPVSDFTGHSSGRVRVTSKRDGLESLQGHEIIISAFTSDTLGLTGDAAPGGLLLSGDAQSGTDKLRLGAE